MSNHLSWLMVNDGWLLSQCRGIQHNLDRFVVHRILLCGCGELRAPLDMWQYSWGLCRVPSRKSRLLSCLMATMEVLCMQRRGIGPHLVARGKSHGFSRLSLGSWHISWCNGQEGPSKFMSVQRRQDSCLVARDTSGFSLGKESQ